ncbi:MAG: hypothetical protein JSR95_19435, partial [Proteobacteria bacterium]|nr:hypothetical protein [Pseudomonadota bacterium]
TPLSDADIKRFTELVRESIGFRSDRGDQISVINQSFRTGIPGGPVEGPGILQQPWVASIARQAVGVGLVLLVAFMVLRPLMNHLTRVTPRRLEAGAGAQAGANAGAAAGAIKLQPSFEQQVAAARSLVGTDPRRAAQVVKDWVAKDG